MLNCGFYNIPYFVKLKPSESTTEYLPTRQIISITKTSDNTYQARYRDSRIGKDVISSTTIDPESVKQLNLVA